MVLGKSPNFGHKIDLDRGWRLFRWAICSQMKSRSASWKAFLTNRCWSYHDVGEKTWSLSCRPCSRNLHCCTRSRPGPLFFAVMHWHSCRCLVSLYFSVCPSLRSLSCWHSASTSPCSCHDRVAAKLSCCFSAIELWMSEWLQYPVSRDTQRSSQIQEAPSKSREMLHIQVHDFCT